MKGRALGRAFFNRPTSTVARELLGKFLVRRYPPTRKRSGLRHEVVGGTTEAFMITETEAYDGFTDRGSHAHRGRTKRNEVMFGGPSHWYVYFVYGAHWMLNVTTREAGYPAAVLIRGTCPPKFRGAKLGRVKELSGPGRLTKYMHIDRRFNGQPLSKKTGLWIENRGVRVSERQVQRLPRVGIDYAGVYWANKRWRFVAKDS